MLGPRLARCIEALLAIEGRSLREILGAPDGLKFCSCMTLFARAEGGSASLFRQALDRFCAGRVDERTLALLDQDAG